MSGTKEDSQNSFQEVEIQEPENPNENSALKSPKNSHRGFEPMPHSSPVRLNLPPSIKPISERNIRYHKILRTAGLLKFFSLVELFFVFLFLAAELYYMLFLVVFPVVGFVSARQLNRGMGFVYFVYILGVSMFRLFFILVSRNPYIVLTQLVMVTVEIIQLYFLSRFLKLASTLTPYEHSELLMLQNGSVHNDYQVNRGSVQPYIS